MSAIRRTMLCAFAGGCLTNAVLFGLWRFAEGTSHSSGSQPQSNHVVELATATAAEALPSVARPSELVTVSAVDPGFDSTTRVAPTQAPAELDSAAPTPAGSAVSDVLTQLETAYRARAAAPPSAQASLTQEPESAAPPENVAATVEAAASAPAQPPPAVIPAALAVAAAPPVVPAVPAAAAPVAVTPAELAPQPAAAPAIALQDAPPPTVVQYGDVNQNTYITNVREGDVYQIQMQQIAVLQYMQLLGMSGGAVAPARRAGGAGRQRGALSSGITNPDNPWGFRFAPLNLVR